ncbi:MAG: prepilin-type N-terminal cleavage/methylation domain-containing protein [Verrucomicrobiales bacterium]
MRFSRRPRPHAFTMTELLVTLVVIAVLAGIAIPVYNMVVRRSHASKCLGNLRSLGMSLNLYLPDHNNTMPDWKAARESKEDEGPAIDTELPAYGATEEVLRCPGDRRGLWEQTGTSYFWNSALNGQHVSNLNLMGLTDTPTAIPVITDKEAFHEGAGDGVNILYADGSVQNRVRFTAEPQR